ncbi:MAG: hypothetical protein ACXWW2_04305 [Candidatus Deferrimicrobiaceae bacterium]
MGTCRICNATSAFILEASRAATSRARGRILRICWETNGSMSERLLDEMVEISVSTPISLCPIFPVRRPCSPGNASKPPATRDFPA